MLSQLSNVLPTGTFLVFQILAPLATNNGNCHHVEVVLTSITLIFLCLLCVVSSFSDNYKADNGMVYYGLVTPWGLWNPNFRHIVVAANPSSYYKGANLESLALPPSKLWCTSFAQSLET